MQILKIIKITFFSALIGTSITFATETEIESKKNISPVTFHQDARTLVDEVERIQNEIKKNYAEARVDNLRQLNKKFRELDYKEDEWEQIAKKLYAYKWPEQNWEQTVGGYLFYPNNLNEILSSSYTEHLIKRIDMIWSFAIAAKYNHPLGQYYLAQTLDTIRSGYTNTDKPKFFIDLYEKSLKTLHLCQDHPDACYILGINHTDYSYKVGIYDFNPKKALEFHEKGEDPRNRLEALKVKRTCKKSFSPPSIQEYLTLAKEGYGPAYIEAAEIEKDFEKKLSYLQAAAKLDFSQALVEIGDLYEEKGDFENAFKYYKEAGEKGVSKGYVNISIMLLGDRELPSEYNKDLTKVSQENINKAKDYLTLAGKANDPEGWNQLTSLYKDLYDLHKDECYLSKIRSSIENGLRLGSSRAYHKAYTLFHADFSKIIQTYGSPPQDDLYKTIRRFLKRAY